MPKIVGETRKPGTLRRFGVTSKKFFGSTFSVKGTLHDTTAYRAIVTRSSSCFYSTKAHVRRTISELLAGSLKPLHHKIASRSAQEKLVVDTKYVASYV